MESNVMWDISPLSWWASLALSVALDLAISSAIAASALAGGIGILLAVFKGAIVSFVVSIVEMAESNDFSVKAWSRLTQNFFLALALPPYLTKALKGLNLGKLLDRFYLWVQKAIYTLLDSLLGMAVEKTVGFLQGGITKNDSFDREKPPMKPKREYISPRKR
jgi:hypothetical protein